MRHLLLTGRPGVGKTTLVRRMVAMISVPAGGFYTEEIRSGGTRLGFRVVSLEGKQGLLAHVDRTKIAGAGPLPRVGKYYVSVADFERVAIPALEDARSWKDLVVVDEIGRMELASSRFRGEILKSLDSPKTVLGVIQDRSDPFLDSIRARPDARLVRVTPENRDRLAADLAASLSSQGET